MSALLHASFSIWVCLLIAVAWFLLMLAVCWPGLGAGWTDEKKKNRRNVRF